MAVGEQNWKRKSRHNQRVSSLSVDQTKTCALIFKKFFFMIQGEKACVGIALSMFAFAHSAAAGEPWFSKDVPTKSQKLYVESSFGWKGGGRKNYNNTRFNDAHGDFSAGRWLDTSNGTDLSINFGYFITDDFRVLIGYKRIKEYVKNWYNGSGSGTWGNGHHSQTDAYVFNVSKDFPVSNTRWTPYVGAGIGLANVARSEDSKYSFVAGMGGSTYSQIMAGLSYSYEKIDLFGEISCGGAGMSSWNYNNSSSAMQTESLRNIAGSFGIGIRL